MDDDGRAMASAVMSKQSKSIVGSDTEPWIGSSDACKHLGISLVTLHRWVKSKRIVPKRTPTGEYRFRRSELDAFLE